MNNYVIFRKNKNWFPENNDVEASAIGVLKDYCKGTTIHGLRYIAMDGSSISDR